MLCTDDVTKGILQMKKTFLKYDKPILTSMVLADTPERTKELIDKSISLGAEAIGMQVEKLLPEYRNEDVYRDLFSYADLPLYATNYRSNSNAGKSDEELSEGLIEFAECGATLCDVMGDIYDKQPGEFTLDKSAVNKQMNLIDRLHSLGAEVIMSSHVRRFISAEEVLKIALEHQRRGADICKIVTGAENMAEQIENLRIVNLLKENLEIPFLYLSGGECSILRRIGCNFGCCMYLGVAERDEFSAPEQPLLEDIKTIRNIFTF